MHVLEWSPSGTIIFEIFEIKSKYPRDMRFVLSRLTIRGKPFPRLSHPRLKLAGSLLRVLLLLVAAVPVFVIASLFERRAPGLYHNTAAVIDADGSYLGKYRKTHIPHVAPGFWEKFYFRPGNLGYPVFDLGIAKIGVYICYDRHFPEGARALGLHGAEIVFNPSATVAGLSEHLWKLVKEFLVGCWVGFSFFLGNRWIDACFDGFFFWAPASLWHYPCFTPFF